MFIDEARVYVKGGDGGPGCMAFRREKYVPRGGPSGGDGGHGGSVVFIADPSVDTLLDFAYHRELRAPNGKAGQGSNCTGLSGKDLEVRVPVGTVVYDEANDLILRDLSKPGDRATIAEGGAGGRGNARFASSTHQAPRETEDGHPGQERHLRLELKLLADVGLVGLPNAGKSTLLSHISAAHPKIANYPFTTRHPCLGIAEIGRYRRLVVADIPGIIEGAHAGHGLGTEFLRHIQRTRVLLHVLDAAGVDGTAPLDAYETLRKELALYGHELAERPHVVAANKMDLPDARAALDELKEKLPVKVYPISGVTGEGLPRLLAALARIVEEQGQSGEP